MSKQEFIEKLRILLSGQISAKLVEENVAYYEDYINSQIRLGYTEEKVLQTLGDPRLIAKSIITANGGDEYTSGSNAGGQERVVNDERYYTETRKQNMPKVVQVHGWLALLIVIVVLVLIVGAVFSIISLLFPVILTGGIVLFFVKLFRDWLN